MKGNTSLWAAKETVNRFQAHDCWAVNSWLTGALLTAHGLTFLGHEHRELILGHTGGALHPHVPNHLRHESTDWYEECCSIIFF